MAIMTHRAQVITYTSAVLYEVDIDAFDVMHGKCVDCFNDLLATYKYAKTLNDHVYITLRSIQPDAEVFSSRTNDVNDIINNLLQTLHMFVLTYTDDRFDNEQIYK